MTSLPAPLAAQVYQQAPAPFRGAASPTAQAQEFEAVFLTAMLSQMFAGIETDGPFGGGQGEEQFRGLLVEEYAKSIAASGGIGLADAVRRELIAIQEDNAQ